LSQKEKDFELYKSKFEATDNKKNDMHHYCNLLKESVKTKDNLLSMQIIDITDLKNRLRDKEILIEKKNQTLQACLLEKHQKDSDMCELRDQMDIRERKINLLNRKV
jgi:hypothetical protein